MLNAEIVEQAIATAHEACSKNKTGCVHAHALAEAAETVLNDQSSTVGMAISDNFGVRDLFALLYNHALHVGYRLHQLEIEAGNAPQKTVSAAVN